MTDPNKLRWYVIAVAVVAGAGLVLTGALTGEQWQSMVGSLLGGAGIGGAAAQGSLTRMPR